MSNNTSVQNPLPAKVEFISYHKPNLEAGTYTLKIQQSISSTNGAISEQSYQTTTDFAVYGERFSINPQEIKSVFPPAASLGDHSNALPNIVINRSTLPWERSAITDNNDYPWLVLLLIDEDEAKNVKSQSMTLADLKQTPTNQFPAFDYEASQHPDDTVTVIDVPKSLLQNIMPSGDDLKLIAHIRQAKDDKDQRIGDEFAVIIGDRLPTPRKQNTVYLISVENRYTDSGFDFSNMGNTIRLVTLKSWQFTCANDQETFEGLLQNLNSSPSTLRLPINSNADAEKYLSQGLVPLNYQQQQGNNSISWYHSPFITGENNHKFSLPVHTSEQLLATNPYNSLVDVSYAAAWELGRLLTLQSKKISVALYNWKSSHRQQLASQEDKILHLPPSSTQIDPSKTSDAAIVKQWFAELSVLKGVPFNYLVPDESMLPIESIRFFQVDSLWVDCLLDGAFSIGRVMKSDYNADQKLGTIQPKSLDTLTGFLLRSDLVSGWPNLQIEYTGTNCTLVRKDYLSSHILLCLFTGKIDSINIQQRPEGLFFGVEDDNGSYRKQIRNSDGSDSGNYVNISWQGDSGKRVIDFPALSTSLNVSNSADFAMQMIEGVGKRTFENNG